MNAEGRLFVATMSLNVVWFGSVLEVWYLVEEMAPAGGRE
jgi:hypothetical protein